MQELLTLTVQANGDLTVSLNTDNTEARQEIEQAIADNGAYSAIYEVLEYQTANGWTLDTLDSLGHLTEAPFLSEDIDMNSNGYYEHVGILWYYADYQVQNFLEEILQYGRVIFTRYESE